MLTHMVVLHVEDTSTLAIGQWPHLSYQPQRVHPQPNVGSARGHACQHPEGTPVSTPFAHVFEGSVQLHWSPASLHTPPLTWRTTFVACLLPYLSVPALPPGCAVEMVTDALHGRVDASTGECALLYDARYVFRTVAGLYTSPALRVRSTLTTQGPGGAHLDANGRGRLVGDATVEKTGGWLCDTLLCLPTTCNTCLDVRFEVDQ